MSSREDIIEVPIEIRISDLAELNRLIQELEEAKNQANAARSQRKLMTSGGSGAPIQREDSNNETLGIFQSGDSDRELLPITGRDKSSRQAVQREKPFEVLKNNVEELQKAQESLLPYIASLGNQLGFTLPYLATGGISIGKSFQRARTGSGINKSPAPMTTVSASSKFGKLASFGKALPYIGVAIMLYEWLVTDLPAMINEQYFGVGKPMDRRFKRVMNNEYASATSRQEKAQIAQGYRSVITSAYSGARGSSNVVNSKERALNNENIYNQSEGYMI